MITKDLVSKFLNVKKINIPSAKEFWCLKCQSYQKIFFKVKGGIPQFIDHKGEVFIGIPLVKHCQTCKNEVTGEERSICGAV